MGWIASIAKGSAGIGRTFENALGLYENDFEVPDYDCLVEIKTKTIRNDNMYKYITLFSAVPDNSFYEIKRIVNNYGYPNKKDKKLKVFNMDFFVTHATFTRKNIFKLIIDKTNKKLILKIYDKYTGILIEDKISWSFDILEQKLYRKFRYMLYVKAKRKFENNKVYFQYIKSKLYILKDFNHFLKALENGYIKITFKIGAYAWGHKYGNIKNHGTSFSIHEEYLTELFESFDLKS